MFLQKKRLSQETGVSVSSVQRATTLLELKPYKIPVVHRLQQLDPNKRLRFCNWVLEKINSGERRGMVLFTWTMYVDKITGITVTERHSECLGAAAV